MEQDEPDGPGEIAAKTVYKHWPSFAAWWNSHGHGGPDTIPPEPFEYAVESALGLLAKDGTLLEIGRKAVEDALIELRDDRLSQPMRGNGLVIREKDGKESPVIRLGVEEALRIGIEAIAAAVNPDGGEKS